MQQERKCPPLDRPWTVEEGAAMVAEWRKSGMSASGFARARGFGYHRLRYWLSRDEEPTSERTDFVVVPFEAPASIEDEKSDEADGPMIEIFMADDVVVRIPMNAERHVITEALKAVLEVA